MRFYIWAAGVFIADQLTKCLAVLFLQPSRPVRVIPQFFWLTIDRNSGAAFSLFRQHTVALTIVTAIATVFILWWGITLPRSEKWMRMALGMIAGGALGNLADRFLRGGLVVDFLDLHWFNKAHWPIFNIADTFICIGVGLMMIETFFRHKKKPRSTPGESLS